MSEELIPPQNIQVDETNNNLKIVRKWLDRRFFSYYLPFAIGWNGFVAFIIWILFRTGNISFSAGNINFSFGNITSDLPQILPLIFLGLFIFLGIYLIFVLIIKLINKTEIIANEEEIKIRYKPIPWIDLKGKRFRVAHLKGFSFKRVHKLGEIPSQNYIYEVYVNTHTGTDQKLLILSSGKEAEFIEKTLEKYYKLEPETENEIEPESKNISTPNLQSKEETPIASDANDFNEIEIPKSIKTNQTDTSLIITRKWLDIKTIKYTYVSISFIVFVSFVSRMFSFPISDNFNYNIQKIITIENSNQIIPFSKSQVTVDPPFAPLSKGRAVSFYFFAFSRC